MPSTDRFALAGVAGCLLAVALLAACLRSRRATRVDPLEVLRSE